MRQRSGASDYATLTQRIVHAGLLVRRPGHYAIRFTALLASAALATWAFFILGDSWLQIPLASVFAVLFTQVAFVAHDVGHRQVFASNQAARVVGMLLGNAGIGLSYGWWITKHTRHHANPNHVEHDPDIKVGGIAWTHQQAQQRHGIAARTFTKWQAYLFVPLLLLEGLDLYWSGIRALWHGDVKRDRGIEILLLAVHTAACLTAVFLVLSPGKALVFLAVQQGAFGLYMASSFAPNHKGMPLIERKLDYLRKQVTTSRNIRSGWFIDHALGGLNYQIEHHLFPSMPMPNLRHAKPLIEKFCAEHKITYHETGLFRSYREILTYLHHVGNDLHHQPNNTP